VGVIARTGSIRARGTWLARNTDATSSNSYVLLSEALCDILLGRSMRKLIAWLSGLGVLIGCGADGSGVGPGDTNVTGSWNAIWQSMTGTGMSCSADGGHLELNQSTGRFTGSYRVQTLTCNGMSSNVSTGAVLNGTIVGNQVAFDLSDAAFHQSGSLTGDEMSGSATWTLIIDGTSHTVTGTWRAVRTCGSAAAAGAFSC
jgi:hypothetical protein